MIISHRRKLLVYIVTVFIVSFGQINADLYLPSILAIANGLVVSIHEVQLSFAIYIVGFGFSQLIYCPLSDGIGRRVPLLIGLALAALGIGLWTKTALCKQTAFFEFFSTSAKTWGISPKFDVIHNRLWWV